MRAEKKETGRRRASTAEKYARMIGALKSGTHSSKELSKLSGLNIDSVRAYVNALREHSPKLAYVYTWEESKFGKSPYARYRLGNRRDAVKPALRDKAGIPLVPNSVFNIANHE